MRKYKMLSDFERVSTFYFNNYKLSNCFFTQPCFAFSHTHSAFNYKRTHRFGIWEENGKIIATACFELDIGSCILNIKDEYTHLRDEMLRYAEKELCQCNDNVYSLDVFSTDEKSLNDFYLANGYNLINSNPSMIYPYKKGFLEYSLPEGFSVISLEEDNDTEKIDCCLWTAFSDTPFISSSTDERLHKQSSPYFSKDLTTVIKAPNGDYACYAGMWVDEKNGYAYLESLGTAPHYRRLGLAKAALMVAMQKTVPLGAKYCYVSDGEFYRSIGCEQVGNINTWRKEWK